MEKLNGSPQYRSGPQDSLIEFWVEGIPRPQGSKRHVGNGRMVEASKHTAGWRKAVSQAALAALPVNPSAGQSALHFSFYFQGQKIITAPGETQRFSGKALLATPPPELLEILTSWRVRFVTLFLSLVAAQFCRMTVRWSGYGLKKNGRSVTKSQVST